MTNIIVCKQFIPAIHSIVSLEDMDFSFGSLLHAVFRKKHLVIDIGPVFCSYMLDEKHPRSKQSAFYTLVSGRKPIDYSHNSTKGDIPL